VNSRKAETPCAVLKTYTRSYSVCVARKVPGGGLSDEITCDSRQPAVRSDATAAACWCAIANFCGTVYLRTSSEKRTLISCQLELITRFVFYYYYNPSPSTDFKHTNPQFAIYVQFCHLRYLVSCSRGFKYMHLGKISAGFAPLDLDFPEQVRDGIYSFSIIIAVFLHFVAVFGV